VQEDARRLIRQEAAQVEQQTFVGPGGVLVEASRHLHAEQPASSPEFKELEKDFCDEQYAYGSAGTNDCGGAADGVTSAIDREEMCSHAAQRLGAPRGRPPKFAFQVDPAYFEEYPRGCFKKNGDTPFWFNAYGEMPKNPKGGTPICHRPVYKTGTNDTNDGGAGCKDTYERLVTEFECRTFAECKGHCAPEEFRVGLPADQPGTDERPEDTRADFYNKRPKGCFINPDTGCVNFNVPQTADPTSPKGTPICRATADTSTPA